MPAPIPKPTDSDHEDVHWALTTANSLQAQGDFTEALRWLRRAVSAAVACDDDQRAVELGRSAAVFEASLSGARTVRVAVDAKETLVDSDATIRSVMQGGGYDLDQPTHVDSDVPPPHRIADEKTMAESGLPSTDREITLVPFTMKAGVAPPPRPQPYQRRQPPGSGTLQLDESPITRDSTPKHSVPQHSAPQHSGSDDAPTSVDGSTPHAYIEPPDESTLSMKKAPNEDELSDTDAFPHAPMSETAHAMAPVPQHRVALLASPDGHDPRVMLLREGMHAPPGAGIAYLIPASSRDIAAIANLLDRHKKK